MKSFEELEPQKEKQYTAPEKEGMVIIGNMLPGYEKDEAFPYFISGCMEKAFDLGLHRLKEKYGEKAVEKSGFGFYPGFGTGYYYMWFRTKPKILKEASQELRKVLEETKSEMLDPERFSKIREAASKAAALYGRRSPDFMQRAYRRTLFTTNEWPDLMEETAKCDIAGVSNYFKRVQDPTLIVVMPENE